MSNSGNQTQQQGQQGFYGINANAPGFPNPGSNGAGTPGGGALPNQTPPHQAPGNGTPPINTGGSTPGRPSSVPVSTPDPNGAMTGTASGNGNGTDANAAGVLIPTTAASMDGAGTAAVNPQQAQQQQQAKELNAASLCRYGQETVQEIVSRTQELYQTLRGAQPPDGKQQPPSAMDRKPKFQETLRNIRGLYKRLRVIYDKIEESFPAASDLPLEERIPYGDCELEPMNEKRDTEAYRAAVEEYEEVKELVVFKNRHLRETMDLMRNIIWDINTMLAMRKE